MKIFVFCIFFLFLFPSVIAVSKIEVTTHEQGRVTNYFDEYFVVNVNGTLELYNPTNDTISGAVFNLDLLSLVYIEPDEEGYFVNGRLNLPEIPKYSRLTINYHIVGITNVDPMLPGHSILYSAISRGDYQITSDFYGELYKADFEDPAYTGHANQRLISVKLTNPTTLDLDVSLIRATKTPALDPNNIIQEWGFINDTNMIVLGPGEHFAVDFLDSDAQEGEVYWLSTDVLVSQISLLDENNVIIYDENDLSIPYDVFNLTLNTTDNITRYFRQFEGVSLTKLADKNLVIPEQLITLSLIFNNFDNVQKSYTLTDTVPDGFIFESLGGGEVDGTKITFSGIVEPNNAAIAKYVLRYIDANAVGVDYFSPAKGVAKSTTVYSNGVRFIRQFVPEKNICTKKLVYLDDQKIKVTLEVRNLGEGPVDNLVIKEHLSTVDLFSEITQSPKEKGVWDVNELAVNDVWQVSYVTAEGESLSLLPYVYGVDQSAILSSLVMENVLAYGFVFASTHIIEFLGIGLLFLLPLVYHGIQLHHKRLKEKGMI